MSSKGCNVALVACMLTGLCCQTQAQSPTPRLRQTPIRYDGWSAATPSAGVGTAASPGPLDSSEQVIESPVQQVAYFQSQGSLSDLPELPHIPVGTLPQGSGAQPRSQLPDFPGGSLNQVLPRETQVLPPENGRPGYGNSDLGYQEQAYAGQAGASALDGSRGAPPPRERPLPASSAAFQQNVGPPRGNAELRPIDPNQRGGTSQGQTGGIPQNQIANGLPFVTPPPRTGRYPTSPYMGPRYQLTNYQLRTIPAQTVAAQSGLSVPDAIAASAQPAVLPQNRNVVGIYPTAYQQCAPGQAVNYPAPGAVPGTAVPPTYPANLTPGLYSPNNSGYAPLFSLGQENYNVMLGRGLIGQPTVYVPGQPFRNFFRYISP